MNGIVKAELLRLRTSTSLLTTSVFVLVAAVLGPTIVLVFAKTEAIRDSSSTAFENMSGTDALAALIASALGAVYVTQEPRYRTDRLTLLAAPRRPEVWAGKGVAHGLWSIVVAAVAVGATFVIGTLAANRLDLSLSLRDSGIFKATASYGAYVVLAALFGGAVGLIVRQPAGAVTAALAWPMAIEPLIGTFWTALGDRLPFTAGATAVTPEPEHGIDPYLGLGTMAGWVVVLALVGLAMLHRSDV
jgi:ABC-2 type transport system permease protein